MADTTQAASFAELQTAVQFAAQQYKAFANADGLLAALSGMEQNQRELTTAIAARKTELADLDGKVATVAAALSEQTTQSAQAIMRAKTDADNIRAQADEYAATTRATADVDTQDRIDKASAKLKQMQEDLATAQAALVAKADELDKIDAKIKDAKAQMAKMLG